MTKRFVYCFTFAFVFSAAALVHAATISLEAFDNATVQPGGPRTGVNGKNFFNMEGSTAGGASFKSFGAADFNFGSLGVVTSFSNVHLTMTESNAAFTAPGNISVYLAANTTPGFIQSGVPPAVAAYQDDSNGLASVDPALLPFATALGTFAFPTTGNVNNGQVDDIALTGFDATTSAAFLAALNAGTPIRLIVTPDIATVAATYAGFSNTTPNFTGPTLSFDYQAVPEPSALMLGGLTLVGLFAARVRRSSR